MNRTYLLVFAIVTAFTGAAQSTAGITGIPDTSYTNYSAYQNTVKDYPYIKLVEDLDFPGVLSNKNIAYCTIGSRQLKLDVFYPEEKANSPRIAIIFIHGGGWRTGNRSQHYALAKRLAKLGYVCITPEYRLSTEALYPAAVYDIKSALSWARLHAGDYTIDTAKIVAAGFSAGGELAAFMGSTNGMKEFEGNNCNPGVSSSANAVVDIDGILSFVHPESGEGDDTKRISAATNWFGYPKKDNYQLWEQASSLTHAGKQTPPTLFINSSVDRMHAGREDFIKILNRYTIYTETKTFEGAPHSFCLFDPWFEPTLQYIDDFLKKVFAR